MRVKLIRNRSDPNTQYGPYGLCVVKQIPLKGPATYGVFVRDKWIANFSKLSAARALIDVLADPTKLIERIVMIRNEANEGYELWTRAWNRWPGYCEAVKAPTDSWCEEMRTRHLGLQHAAEYLLTVTGESELRKRRAWTTTKRAQAEDLGDKR